MSPRTPERVALVTGAAGGIGSATVRRLTRQGYAVIGVDVRDAHALEGGIHVVADVRDRGSLHAAVDRALDRWGRLDAAVAAAAIIRGGQPLWEAPDDETQEMWDVDVRGVWNTAAVAVPAMLAGPDPRGCRFVAIASAAASHGLHHLAGYNAAKHAVVGVVRGLAADLVGTGVTAVAVSPGSTRTPMLEATAALYDLPGTDGFAANQLLGRLLAPEEVAAVIAFCCAADAAALNGGLIQADGGFRP